jgi:hypothetical protein
MNNADIALLLAPRKRKAPQGKGRKFTSEGWEVLTTTTECGTFRGKAGTIKRNRKGRTTRMPNGWRTYPVWNDGTEALAYKLK